MFDQAGENFGQRAAGFAGCDQVHVNRRKDAGKIPKRLRKTAAIDERLVERVCHLLQARLLEPLLQDRQSFIERHSGLEQMGELLGEDEQLVMRDF